MNHSSTNNSNFSSNPSDEHSNEDVKNKKFSNTSTDFNFILNSEGGLMNGTVTPSKLNSSNSSSKKHQNRHFTSDPNYPVDPNYVIQNHLQKLDFLYQNLESRVQKLENYVADQLLSSNMSISSGRSQGISITPAFTMNDFSNSASCSNGVLSIMETVPKEISKSDLDDYCSPILHKKATPSIGELNSIVMNLKKLKYPELDNKFILSKVREWFRRKREYMSQRIFNVCFKKYGHLVQNPVAIEELLHKARNDPKFINEIGRESNLDIINEAAAWEFCSEKVSSYFENLNTSNNGSNGASASAFKASKSASFHSSDN